MSVQDGTELIPYSWEIPGPKECYKYKDTIPGKYRGKYLGTFKGNVPETSQDSTRPTGRSYYLFDNNFKTTHIDYYTDSAEFKKFEERKTYGPDGKMTNIVYYNKDIEVTPCMSAESPKSFWSSLFGRGGRAKRTRRTMPRTKRRSSKSRSRHHTRSRKS